MSTFNDNFQAVAAVWEVDRRIIYHCGAGRMLSGLKYDKEGTMKLDGEDDLPLLQPWTINFTEEYFAGAPHSAINDKKYANQPTIETLTLSFRLAASRRNGWIRRDPTNAAQKKGFLEWISLIRDAIETDVDGVTDSRMGTGIVKPVLFSTGETTTTELSFQCFLEAKFDVWPYHRGERHMCRPKN